MAKGLDVGTMNLIAASREGAKTVFRQQRNLFVEIESSEVAEKMLAMSDVPHIRKDNEVFVVGEDALNFANVLNTTTRRPMKRGILSRDEKSAIPMVRLIVERLVGEPKQPGELLMFTSPARPVDVTQDVLYHQKTIQSILRKLDFTPKILNEGMAVVYSELADTQFSGLGISFGAGMTNACFAHIGVPVMTMAVARGGDWIDGQASEATGLTKDRITAIKEGGFQLGTTHAQGGPEAALTIYYDALIDYVLRFLHREVTKAGVEQGLSVPVAVTGGTSAPKGFLEVFERKFREQKWPFQVSGIRRGKSPLHSVAAGALIAARVEEETGHAEPVAALA